MKKQKNRRRLLETEMQKKYTSWVKRSPDEVLAVFGNDWQGIAYELKVGGETLPFSEVKEHQEIDLLKACGKLGVLYPKLKGKILNHKISDQSQGYKPFDGFMMRACDAYLIIGFHGGYDWVALHVDEWITYKKHKTKNGRGSISYEDALKWGFKVKEV